jgi:hypothetical protein
VAVLLGVAIGLFLIHKHGQTSPGQQPGSSAGGSAATAQTPVAAAAGAASTGPLPSGWHWYTVSATQAGTNAGFKLAVPDTWSAYSKGEAYYFEAPGNDTFLQVDLTPHTKDNMAAEARYLALLTQQQGKFPGYAGQIIRAVNIRGTVGAAWSFTWQNPDLGRVWALDLMYIATTSAGQQSYAMYMTSPVAAYSGNLATFTEEMRTFQPVP